MPNALIASGCNLGDCQTLLEQAYRRISQLSDTSIRAKSSFVSTRPVGIPDCTARFLNGCVRIDTQLTPAELMRSLLAIEKELGRDRSTGNGLRPIDLDLLLYEDENGPVLISGSDLQLPHPRMSFRRFVLSPAVEIAPHMAHPLCRMTLAELLAHLDSSPNRIILLCPDNHMINEFVEKSGRNDDMQRVKATVVRNENREITETTTGPDHWIINAFLGQLNERVTRPLDTKLLIRIAGSLVDVKENEHSLGFAQEFRGPIWDLPNSDTEHVIGCVVTAIESMQPLSLASWEGRQR